jgi:hypothetical protein
VTTAEKKVKNNRKITTPASNTMALHYAFDLLFRPLNAYSAEGTRTTLYSYSTQPEMEGIDFDDTRVAIYDFVQTFLATRRLRRETQTAEAARQERERYVPMTRSEFEQLQEQLNQSLYCNDE